MSPSPRSEMLFPCRNEHLDWTYGSVVSLTPPTRVVKPSRRQQKAPRVVCGRPQYRDVAVRNRGCSPIGHGGGTQERAQPDPSCIWVEILHQSEPSQVKGLSAPAEDIEPRGFVRRRRRRRRRDGGSATAPESSLAASKAVGPRRLRLGEGRLTRAQG